MKLFAPGVTPIALCYVRLSYTRDQSDSNSPERQRANIATVCERNGWTPKWFEDAQGHMSGRTENRPAWQELKGHLHDVDVVAVVANDLSRLHRKIGRMSDLVEECEKLGLQLVQAAPGRHFDTSTPSGKMFANFQAMMDQGYADEVSFRMKDSVRYRRQKGIIVGMVPFGTVRPIIDGKPGYLQRSPYGIWLFPDGSIVEGHEDDNPPVDGGIWRGYLQAAERALRLFAENRYGRRKIAIILNQEGYRHADVRNVGKSPGLFNQEHIRSISLNWPEYGGAVIGKKARARKAKEYTPESITLVPERAIFDLDLLYQVARVTTERTVERRQPDYSTPGNAAAYPLATILYCAHCERIALETGDPSYRTYLTGLHAQTNKQARYRHREIKHLCTAKTASVKAALVEADFARLVTALTVRADVVPIMTAWFRRINQRQVTDETTATKLAEIANLRQQIKNTDKLLMWARIGEQEHIQHVQECERQIARLQAELSDEHEVRQMLEITVQTLTDMDKNWNQATDEERQRFARSLFSELIYDLDARRIVGFKLKPWAEPFLQLRVALTELLPNENSNDPHSEQKYSDLHPAGIEPTTPGSEDLRSIR